MTNNSPKLLVHRLLLIGLAATLIYVFTGLIGAAFNVVMVGGVYGGWVFLLGAVAAWIVVNRKFLWIFVTWLTLIVLFVGLIKLFLVGISLWLIFSFGYIIGGIVFAVMKKPPDKAIVRVHNEFPQTWGQAMLFRRSTNDKSVIWEWPQTIIEPHTEAFDTGKELFLETIETVSDRLERMKPGNKPVSDDQLKEFLKDWFGPVEQEKQLEPETKYPDILRRLGYLQSYHTYRKHRTLAEEKGFVRKERNGCWVKTNDTD